MKVLFLCTANSCRSQMAEAFARHYGSGIVEPYSAGTHPTRLHPMTVEVLAERGISTSGQRAKGLTEVPLETDLVVTVCDQEAEACPVFPGRARTLHWSLPDPAQVTGTPEEVGAAFRKVRDEIEARVLTLIDQVRSGMP